jgi:hypothetical protein
MVHTIIRTTIGQYYVNKAVTRGFERANMQPGSVTFLQRFGSALHVNLHFHGVFLEGVSLARTEAGLTPRCVTGEPPTDAAMAAVLTQISQRVMRTLRQRGYLEAGLDACDARRWTLWRRWPRSCPCRVSTWGALAAVWRPPAPCVERSSPRQQGRDEEAMDTGSPRWTWARRLKRVLALAMARGPGVSEGRCGFSRLLVCRTPCLGSVLHARTRVQQSLVRARCSLPYRVPPSEPPPRRSAYSSTSAFVSVS